MATVGNRHHIEAYIWLPNSLKRDLFKEFLEDFPETDRIQFWTWARGKRPFPVEKWQKYLNLLIKYDTIWEEQIQGKNGTPKIEQSNIPLTA